MGNFGFPCPPSIPTSLFIQFLCNNRVKDIDFGQDPIFVRESKGDKDRATILPKTVKDMLEKYLDEVKKTHDKDLREGYGEVYLPDALERKYPNASKKW